MAKAQFNQTCSVDGCGQARKARGWCYMHYSRWKVSGEVGPAHALKGARVAKKACPVAGCERETRAGGMCMLHYARKRNGIDLNAPYAHRRWEGTHCQVSDCDRPRSPKAGGGLCAGHYTRYRNGLSIDGPLRSHGLADLEDPDTWNRTETSSGYVSLYAQVRGEKRSMAEHRWIMQKHIGRELLDDEDVHHINGVRNDNRIENLEIWSYSHPRGQRAEDKADWAIGILELYRPELLAH